ncbi:MAG: glycosyltransferase family 1 protein [Actinobacteria bacterium]|nr:glycosyltransferase family 1 protein [Actinomycetota bacterium]
MPKVHQFSVYPEIPPRLGGLQELAVNLRWTWDIRAYKVFQHLDPEMLEKCGGNPVRLLRRISRERLEHAAAEPAFLTHMNEALADLRRYLGEPGWFRSAYPEEDDLAIAYFSMEYGLAACLPVYSGGLGVLSGDHLKSASDLDLPLVAVGLLYNKGYFTQRLNNEGWQYEEYRVHDLSTLPVLPVAAGDVWRPASRTDPDATAPTDPGRTTSLDGRPPLKISVDMAGRTVWARVWRVQVGRISLYLLDSALPENDSAGQRITSELYGGGVEDRLAQELLLGVGGMRALKALGVSPQVCHLNEGHTVFSSLERMREAMKEHGLTFLEARQATSAGTLFTTHTPVSAGFDLFSKPLIDDLMGGLLGELGLETETFMGMGRVNPEAEDEEFNVAILALRQAPRRNAVSRLHRRTTARMMQPGWVDFAPGEMPIESVTNGVHTKSWVASEMAQLFDHYLGPRWREEISSTNSWQRVERIPDLELWHAHSRLRERLVAYAREQAGARESGLLRAGAISRPTRTPLRPDALTIGFARRFATYKRATLLFHDVERLKAILLSETRPVQLIVAGKSHPRDGAGKDFIRQLLDTVKREGLSDHVVFLEDYDLSKTAMLVQGADVWLNTPRRPYEACGTSGMKVAPNGGLNLSVLDGWWAEAYRPGAGWAIGNGEEFVHAGYQDEVDAGLLYSLLEQEVVPLFYERDADGLPRGWIALMKNSIRILTPAFSGDRMVRQYTERFYLPIAERYRRMKADDYAKARELSAWKTRIRGAWCDVKIIGVEESSTLEVTVGENIEVAARVCLGSLDRTDVLVEAYCSGLRPDGNLRNGRRTPLEWVGCDNGVHLYRGAVLTRAAGLHGYSVRVLPCHADMLVPHELPLVTWEEAE